MKTLSTLLCSFCIALLVPASLNAKGETVMVEIAGGYLTAPLIVTDPRLAGFDIWAGPGVHGVGITDAEGFIIDWQKGIAARPAAGLPRFQLSFYAGCRTDPRCKDAVPYMAYVVFYVYNPATPVGFVYLPGKADPTFDANAATIMHGHGAEGHWFTASPAWEAFVRPLIAKANGDKPPR